MKNFYVNYFIKYCVLAFLFFLSGNLVFAQENTPLRRPISSQQPMYLLHIDTWNYADPQKIIDLIPEDIRPYVVMNISLSISHDVASSRFQVAEYGYEIARSWLRTCAQNRMWATVQHSSGGFAHFSDFDLSVYEEFFIEYPNFIGFNYAEQFWGFDDSNDPLSPKWTDRMDHLANLLKLSNRYGGYLLVSWCGNQWSPPVNPIGMLKRNPDFAAACEKYTDNYILFEKYTQQSYQSDMESLCLGAYLSGYSGNYGIRYDGSGWTDVNGDNHDFTMATAGAVHLEHMMLTGATIIDGPELIWTECFRETNRKSTTDGYSMRDWETFPQFLNVTVDIFRKILDGTVRIPTRKEVIDRTKFVVVNDVNSGGGDDIYSSPRTLFEGLYRMDGDGNYENNKSFFKKTGRYPTIPTVFALNDEAANSFKFQINRSDYSNRWPTISSKVDELNNQFPEEYTGDLYAGRHENGWVIYNPFKTGQTASANIPFKYNSCEYVELTYSQYTSSVMKESSNQLSFYLNNFDNVLNNGLKTDIIKVYGSSSEPTYSYTDRGEHQESVVSSDWINDVFTLTVEHNGPIDITVNCAGTGTERLTSYTTATLIEPANAPVYVGPRQYEAECFDYKSITGITTGGYNSSVRNYTGQGYLRVGRNSQASVRKTVYALRNGTYQLITRYSVTSGDVNSLDLYVNGEMIATPIFSQTATSSDWGYNTQSIELNAGENVIEFKATRAASYLLMLDNIVITQGNRNGIYDFENDEATTDATVPPAELVTILSGSAGVVEYADNNGFKAYSTGAINSTGVADLDMFNKIAQDYTVVWKEIYASVGTSNGLLLRGSGDHGSCSYAIGMKQGYLFVTRNNPDNTVTLKTYLADASELTEKTEFTTAFKVMPEQPYWVRAKAVNDQFNFECSIDSIDWVGSSATSFTDETYPIGSTQLIWGMETSNFDWIIDNIAFVSETVLVSKNSMDGFTYSQGRGPSTGKSFNMSGNSLSGDIEIYSSPGFEISTNPTDGFSESLIVKQSEGSIPTVNIYVRLEEGLPVEIFSGRISILYNGIEVNSIMLNGEVSPQSTVLKYDFSSDVAAMGASTPPALDISIAQVNTATAGVVSFTDVNQLTSNVFRPYGVGQRNATGVVNLDLFPDDATEYSVTWKQYLGSVGTGYKTGVLLRGDTEKFGTVSTGYVQGIMHGYLFIVYNTGNNSEFRIYRSSSAFNSLTMLTNIGVGSLVPSVGQPVWYRASVSGTTSVSLTFEYSTDGEAWNRGAFVTDNTSPAFTSGATQIVWGLAAPSVDFFMDDITFNGLHQNSGTLPESILVSESSLDGFAYNQGAGPSEAQSFVVSGSDLSADIVIDAPFSFELSLDPLAGFNSTLILDESVGLVGETIIYVRLKSGLSFSTYTGEVLVSSPGVLSKVVALKGDVIQATGLPVVKKSNATVLSTEYFSITGQKFFRIDNQKGLFFVKKSFSDGTILVEKVIK